jgi:putative ABC transport system permease protein
MLSDHLKIALRNLRNNPSFTLLNVLGLGLGMSGAVLIFLFVQYHFNVDKFHPHSDRLFRVVLDLNLDEGKEYESGSSLAMATALGSDYAQVDQVGFIRKSPNTTFSAHTKATVSRFVEKENAVFADSGFMEMFVSERLEPQMAAYLNEPNTVVISEKIANKYFGTVEASGKVLRMDNKTDLRVAAVLKDLTAPTDLAYDIYISLPTLLTIEPGYETDNFSWTSARNSTFVRLVSGEDASALERQIGGNGRKYYGEIAKYYTHVLQPLETMHFDERYGGKIRPGVLWILSSVGVFLLVIACINFINLATGLALKRAREFGVRKVLGSSRRQLFWQFMMETALLTSISAVASMILVIVFLPLLNIWTGMQNAGFAVAGNYQLYIFWVGTCLAVLLLAGFYPAVIVAGFNPIAALKGTIRARQAGSLGVRRLLVAAQLVIALVLVTEALVLLLQMRFFRNTDLGFNHNAIVILSLPQNDRDPRAREVLRQTMLQYPEVKSVTFQYEAPTSDMGYGGSVRFDNKTEWEKFMIRDRFGDQYYLETYQLPLLAGRSFLAKDSITEFVVNEEFMKRVGVQEAQKMLGKQLEDGNTGLKGEIVGVVRSFHLKSLQNAIEPCAIFARPTLYKQMAVKLGTGEVTTSLGNLRAAWLKIYPDEVFDFHFLDDQIARFYQHEQQLTHLIQAFALVAVIICCLGLFGMISFMVSYKTREIGVRKVLGAGVISIVWLFGREFLLLIGGACLVAVPAVLYLARQWLANFVYRIDLEWWLPALGCLVIVVVTLLTVGIQVAKAALADPVKSLRSD